MGQAERRPEKLSTGLPKDLCFQVFFGVSANVAVEAWEMMENYNFLPPDPKFIHYLWALAFMQMSPPNDEALSRMLGGSDPKTIHKYMWLYVDWIFELDNHGKLIVVSFALL